MDNRDIGRAFATAAEIFWRGNGEAPVPREHALAVLDAVAQANAGTEPDFGSEFISMTPLSRLVAVAFDATQEECDEGLAWLVGPERRFRERYRF